MLETKEEIISWLDDYGVQRYTVNEDLTVDVDGYVTLNKKGLTSIPVQFGYINGSFGASDNELTSLEGFPHSIKYDCFFENNKITTLEHCPKHIGGNMHAMKNPLQNLALITENLEGTFNFSNKKNKFPELTEYYDDYGNLSIKGDILHSIILKDKLDAELPIHNLTLKAPKV